jgi:hypothetical protein
MIEKEFEDFVREITDGLPPPPPTQLMEWRWLFFAGWRCAFANMADGMSEETKRAIFAELEAHKEEIIRLAGMQVERVQ